MLDSWSVKDQLLVELLLSKNVYKILQIFQIAKNILSYDYKKGADYVDKLYQYYNKNHITDEKLTRKNKSTKFKGQ